MDQPGGSSSNPGTAVPASTAARPMPVASSDRVAALAWVIAVVFVAVELAFSAW
jgi:hypothetical protein